MSGKRARRAGADLVPSARRFADSWIWTGRHGLTKADSNRKIASATRPDIAETAGKTQTVMTPLDRRVVPGQVVVMSLCRYVVREQGPFGQYCRLGLLSLHEDASVRAAFIGINI